jgi:hypothetical protein
LHALARLAEPTHAVRKPGHISGQSVKFGGESFLFVGHCPAPSARTAQH